MLPANMQVLIKSQCSLACSEKYTHALHTCYSVTAYILLVFTVVTITSFLNIKSIRTEIILAKVQVSFFFYIVSLMKICIFQNCNS